jgi:hypothetical protein
VTGKWKVRHYLYNFHHRQELKLFQLVLQVTVSANALPVSGNQLFAIVITSAGTVSYA